MITKHARLRINAIHGDFLGSLGPILINLWKKTKTLINRDSIIGSGQRVKLKSILASEINPGRSSHGPV